MRVFRDVSFFLKEVGIIVRMPVFILLTTLGNLWIGLASIAFYFIENGHNPKVTHLMDAFWFCFAASTTTGFGDIVPVTHAGRILGILLMLVGTAIFAMYTGLFAEAILNSEPFKKRRS